MMAIRIKNGPTNSWESSKWITNVADEENTCLVVFCKCSVPSCGTLKKLEQGKGCHKYASSVNNCALLVDDRETVLPMNNVKLYTLTQ